MLKRKILTLRRLLQTKGFTGLVTGISDEISLQRQLFAARRQSVVELDGCRFDTSHMPNTPIKLELLKGSYESFERQAVQKYVKPALPIIELGGCLGVVSCISNHLLQDPRAHVVVEANPHVIPLLEANRLRNDCSFSIVNSAIAYEKNAITFQPERDLRGTSLSRGGDAEPVTVAATDLRKIVEERKFTSFTLICDIEGHECELVEREPEIVKMADTIILETHARMIGEEKNEIMLQRLKDIGFQTVDTDVFVVVMRKSDSSQIQVA